MNNFELIKLNNSEYDYLVIATTYISPISTLTDIENELTEKSGKIIFDLTLINATSSNRYVSASIEDGIVNRRSFDVVKAIEPNVERISLDFFVHHADLVENGTIPGALKSLLSAGVCV
ncbi:type II toxin-antitoxin system RnlB family antitoxin [Lachnospiraceae bacterium 45-W7]